MWGLGGCVGSVEASAYVPGRGAKANLAEVGVRRDDDSMKTLVASLTLLVCVTGLGCVHAQVRQSDLDAWRGVSRVELQTHPLFSTLPKQVEVLPDGSEQWRYSNCSTSTSPVVCNRVGQTNICSGGRPRETCCHNQFLVQGDYVVVYRAVGNCYTDCTTRPASRMCEH